VADETDFLDLYSKLRLEPNCTLADFKQAYRRHVAAWHPDRRRGSRADALAAGRLQRLTAQYSAAMEFHRRHGRLPGAVSPPRVSVVATSTEAIASAESDTSSSLASTSASTSASVSFEGDERFEDTPLRAWRTRWLWIAALVVVAVIAWSLIPVGEADEDDASTDTSVTTASTP
jgi:curved DNA-binding protein CbpA